MISVEGKRFWVLALLPMRRSRLLLGKYAFSLSGALLLMIPLVLLGAWMLRVPARMAWMHALTALGMCLGLPGIAVGMGALFPNYREESPAKIVSGFGGTLCLVLSIAFVGLLVIVVGGLSLRHISVSGGGPGLSGPLLAAAGVAVALTFPAVTVPLSLGCRAINRAEL
jgi:ABC-2 type transport system permease protein